MNNQVSFPGSWTARSPTEGTSSAPASPLWAWLLRSFGRATAVLSDAATAAGAHRWTGACSEGAQVLLEPWVTVKSPGCRLVPRGAAAAD